MTDNNNENIILMALLMVTRDDILSCADELGMSEDEITEELVEAVREKVGQGLNGWREAVREMVKEAIKCPLGLVCSPSCAWREVGGCMLPKEVK